MKRLAALLVYLASSMSAYANVPCALPFTIVNGTPADATQVMANYNALVTCLANAALAGPNSDITQLLGLTTPLAVSAGGSSVYIGTTSTGAANAQVVASPTPVGFTLTQGYRIVFVAGFSNTAATTLNVAGTGATNVFRRTSGGAVALAGGEIIAGVVVEAIYDGTQFQLEAAVSPLPVGTVLDYVGATAPPGFLLATGACIVNATFPALTTLIGTGTFGACGAGSTALPDLRGRMVAGIDSGGSNRITVAGGNFDGTVIGGAGGSQNHTLTIPELPAVTPAGTNSTPTITLVQNKFGISNFTIGPAAGGLTQGGSSLGMTAALDSPPVFTGTPFGAGSAHTVLSPVVVMNKIIKY